MAIVIQFPTVKKDSVIFKHIPDDVSSALFIGYVVLRKSIAGLTVIIEEYGTDPLSPGAHRPMNARRHPAAKPRPVGGSE